MPDFVFFVRGIKKSDGDNVAAVVLEARAEVRRTSARAMKLPLSVASQETVIFLREFWVLRGGDGLVFST